MRRADRLFQIVQFLRDGRLTTAAKLSEKLEVSERTIYRDIADLIGTGVPIDGEAGVGYIMREGYDLPPLMFTRSENVAPTAGARLIRAWGGTAMAEAAEDALVKIRAVLPEDARARAGSRLRDARPGRRHPRAPGYIRTRRRSKDPPRTRLCNRRRRRHNPNRPPAWTVVLGQSLDACGVVRTQK